MIILSVCGATGQIWLFLWGWSRTQTSVRFYSVGWTNRTFDYFPFGASLSSIQTSTRFNRDKRAKATCTHTRTFTVFYRSSPEPIVCYATGTGRLASQSGCESCLFFVFMEGWSRLHIFSVNFMGFDAWSCCFRLCWLIDSKHFNKLYLKLETNLLFCRENWILFCIFRSFFKFICLSINWFMKEHISHE